MDSHLASVLISGSSDIQNGSRCAEGPEPVAEACLDSKGRRSACSAPGNLRPCPVETALAVRRDALSITGKKPQVGGTCKPASQEESCIGGFKQPIAAEPGVPVPSSQPIRLRCVVPPQRSRPIANSAICRTKDFPCSAFTSAATLADKNRNNTLISADGEESERKEKGLRGIKAGATERSTLEAPPSQPEPDFQPWKRSEEQTEPLDLSLPRKRERRCGRLLDDSGGEGLLIMEVDEYEGEGDRDVVEEDEGEEEEEAAPHVDSLLPPFFPTSVLTSLPLTEEDPGHLLLIDDRGIPYTLDPDGLKVPQVDVPASEDPPTGRSDSAEEEGRRPPSSARPGPSQSSDALAVVAAGTSAPSPAAAADVRPAAADVGPAPDPERSAATGPGPSAAAEPGFRPSALAPAVPRPTSGTSAPSQPIQIFPSHPVSAPLLFLSSSSSSSLLSSAPLGLTLPLAVNQPASCSSTPMFLLLSSVASSSGESTSTPIAVLDPSTGQLSQIDAASAPVSLPLPPGEVGNLASPLPTIPHPVIRLTTSNPAVVVPGVSTAPSGPVFTPFPPAASSPALLRSSAGDPPIPTSGSKAIVGGDAEEASHISHEPLPPAGSPPPAPGGRSPAPEPRSDLSGVHPQHLPLDDHLYFSNPAASPSPPALSPGRLHPLEPLDPDSPGGNMGPRRVLYCQLCPRVFFYLSDLERHAITHSQKKPYVCQQCGKAFKRSSHLQRHKHIHTGQRNFVCSICAKRFREAGELQRHQRVHTGEKPYQCQLCHTRFAERNTLRRHTKRKHPYHQVAMEMLNEGRGGGRGGEGGALGSREEEEESAEWYSSTVSNLENSEWEGES